ncbi:MAG: class I SAM-dependent DNA methyltransferase, partial [Chromatiales bacterium]|nr:class I SAM-dependent DNA methyltransferase [Chromatiales bacterium]
MRLSWNEVRVRAATFADEWSNAVRETSETHSFYNAFFRVFGVERRSVARYEEHVAKLDNSSGFIDLFWPGVLIVEQKSAGRDLSKAYGQAGEYFDALKERDRPRYILVSDFQTFELHDLDERTEVRSSLKDLPAHVEHFGFILGVQKRTFRDQDPANIKAAELVGRLHDALHAANYRGHDLERFLVRIVFCLFADDTGIFEPRDIFLEFIETRTSEDGADLGPWLRQVFEVLNSPEEERSPLLDEDLARFPYVNGDLFREHLRTPSFNASMREALLDVCRFDWSNISPAIFGALFQSVMEPEQRRAQGAHYTTEKNILKVIEPLFMDDLRAEFKHLKSRKDSRRRTDLRRFQEKLGSMRFFDPACGCGNFLIIAYRELRQLEIEVLKEIHPNRQLDALAEELSLVDVDQFYGIELGEFPARIAETAMWMMDHIMNNRLSLEFGQTYVRIPLESSPHIMHGDALEVDWQEVLPPEKCSFVFGNPPFIGAKFQTAEQRAQVRRIAALGKSGGTLDYVTAWFIKAGDYVQEGSARIGFVATNSITQGEQVAQLWPILLDRLKLEIAFAHRTFAWGSDARGKAHVHVAILGVDQRDRAGAEKRLFSYTDINGEPEESRHAVLSPYLFDAAG